ncbi:Threonine/homoserine/homoserine lactone efflux protein [Vibrio crassostreae]|uniref:LysE family translocator n=1 Tax=Vibrio crassostreae TaxID=246167 RepID=UPI001042B067|nr:LysE family translocator [Vibrio crassostreae]TCN86850.1 threonine/homoserine/homoserine lactone efflux protein [Vibrio crassostreae]CAK2445834.1 Threonine/homoserine/homoserine lactone efflux protein [Vibrio crassostreae]CAK2524609.1 Threonine/homoserine/homoserine lactone efflux protein [Vibrio crassostreae]CAK3866732.1 Threonine/homoserine/homoserine lactone efflux protein [Vibrio crassostreae]CAK3907733.1 Threonine/homoserine/homoserine lactone efflux protein [Vibrio crassostreae]
MSLDSIWLFIVIVFFIAIIPGPNALLVLSTALTQRKLFAFVNVLGVSCGFFFHAFISANGISLLLSSTPMAFEGLKWAGVLYLVWLGYNHFRAALRAQEGVLSVVGASGSKLYNQFFKGLLTNLLNPKIVLFYLSIFPQFVSKDTIVSDSLMLGGIQAIVVSMWFLVVILMADTFKRLLVQKRTSQMMNIVCGVLFVGFSIQLALFQL